MKYQQTNTGPSWLFAVLAIGACMLPCRRAQADLTIDATCLEQPAAGVRIGRGIAVVQAGDVAALRFHDEGITVPLGESLSAGSGTVQVRFQLPSDWPSETRGTLFHVGDQSHVHATLFVGGGRMTAV